MAKTVFVDTGPIFALIDSRDSLHNWVVSELNDLTDKLITNTAVVSEVLFLLKRQGISGKHFYNFVEESIIEVQNPYPSESKSIHHLMNKYEDLPASFADICLLEQYNKSENAQILSTDSDFLVYKDAKGKSLNLISPYIK